MINVTVATWPLEAMVPLPGRSCCIAWLPVAGVCCWDSVSEQQFPGFLVAFCEWFDEYLGNKPRCVFHTICQKNPKEGLDWWCFPCFPVCLMSYYHCHPTIFTRKHPAPKRRFLRRTLLTTAGPFLAQSEVEVPPKNTRGWGDSWSVTHRND